MIEIWKSVVGYEGLYEVSNLGRVKSFPRNGTIKDEKILKPFIDKLGRKNVFLSKNNKRKRFRIHRLVAEAFIPNPHNYPIINHKDENPSNNFVDNLEWCDHSYNVNYGTANSKRSKKQSKPVLQYDLQDNLIREWSSATEAGRDGFKFRSISACCNGKRKSHKGYKWSYK